MTSLLLPGKITFPEARQVLAALLEQARALKAGSEAQQGALRVDASGLVQFDSSVVVVLLEFMRSVAPREVAVQQLPQALQDLLKVYGAQELFQESRA